MAEKTGEHDVLGRKHVQGTYDKVANNYDELWTKHVAEPNDRITRDLRLTRGERVVDLACGTGLYTLEMGRLVAPGEVVGVDYSAGMLATAKERMASANLPITLVESKAEDFLENATPESFDAMSVRFLLAYLDWAATIPRFARIIRPGGRVGILTSLSDALPQLWKVWDKMTGGQLPLTAPVPDSLDQIAGLLEKGGMTAVETQWKVEIRLWFDTGYQAMVWMKESGYGTHPALQHMDAAAIEQLMQLMGTGLEELRESQGVPLEINAYGMIMRK